MEFGRKLRYTERVSETVVDIRTMEQEHHNEEDAACR